MIERQSHYRGQVSQLDRQDVDVVFFKLLWNELIIGLE